MAWKKPDECKADPGVLAAAQRMIMLSAELKKLAAQMIAVAEEAES